MGKSQGVRMITKGPHANWQLNSCDDERFAGGGVVNLRRLYFQYRMDFIETTRICARLLRRRKVRRISDTGYILVVSKNVKQSRYRPGVAQRFPGS